MLANSLKSIDPCNAAKCLVCLLLSVAALCGCNTIAPIHVWQPAQIKIPPATKLALAPIAGDVELARMIEQAMLAQRPAAAADVAIFTAEQLVESSPIRLASTAPLNNDSLAIQAARGTGADILLQGEILYSDISRTDLLAVDKAATEVEHANMNNVYFQRLNQSPKESSHQLMLSWRFIDVRSGKTVGSKSFTLFSEQAAKQYPDLVATHQHPAAIVIAASARETWMKVAPVVAKEKVRLAVSWAQPGASLVRRGVRAAKQGQWDQAEVAWQTAVEQNGFNAAAHHNLAIALAAREDFTAAKRELGLAHGVFSYHLPHETLFWLDQKHRLYHQAHGIPTPLIGWSIPDAADSNLIPRAAEPIHIADLPWWTAIPLAKPPHWTWRNWIAQAWPL